MIAPQASAGFVANMEDVLEVYQRPHDPLRPVVCLDETSKQMIIETRAPIPATPGRKARHDYEYERNGVANSNMDWAACTRVPMPRECSRTLLASIAVMTATTRKTMSEKNSYGSAIVNW